MGLTHYWEREQQLNTAAFALAINDCVKLLSTSDYDLAGPDGTGEPVLEPGRIEFNGKEPATCEPFRILTTEMPRNGRSFAFSCCKTEHLPYDEAVRCTLIILKHYLGDSIRISSDDDRCEWDNCCTMCQRVFGYGEDFKIDK